MKAQDKNPPQNPSQNPSLLAGKSIAKSVAVTWKIRRNPVGRSVQPTKWAETAEITLALRACGPATEPKNAWIPEIRKNYEKKTKPPTPGLNPENTRKIRKTSKIGQFWTVFVLSAPNPGWAISYLFRNFSYFWDSGVFGLLSGTGDSQRDSRESIRANHSQLRPYFYSASGWFARIARISDSRDSPDSCESCESIRTNHTTKLGSVAGPQAPQDWPQMRGYIWAPPDLCLPRCVFRGLPTCIW